MSSHLGVRAGLTKEKVTLKQKPEEEREGAVRVSIVRGESQCKGPEAGIGGWEYEKPGEPV